MLKRLLARSAFLTVSLLVSAPGIAQSPDGSGPRSSYEGDETFAYVGDLGLLKGEHIDPRTRALEWRVEDLLVPGNGGLPLRIGRVQPNLASAPTQGINFITYHWNGIYLADWDLDIPHIVKAVQPGVIQTADHCDNHEVQDGFWTFDLEFIPPSDYRGPMQLALPGSSELLMLKHASATQYPSNAKYVTANNTVVHCDSAGGFVVRTPDGMTYHLGQQWIRWYGDIFDGEHGGKLIYLPTLVEDPYGNTLTFEYDPRVSITSRCGVTRMDCGSVVALRRIVASDGRVVEFFYNDYAAQGVRPRIERFVFDGKQWTFQYTGAYVLSQVTDPEARTWSYQYTNQTAAVSDWVVTLPTGAVVTYDREVYSEQWSSPWLSGTDLSYYISTRTVTGPNIPAGSVWQFGYQQTNDQEIVTITGPERTVRHTFRRGWNSPADSHILQSSEYWQAGQLLKTEVFDTGSPGTLLRTVENYYSVLPQIGATGAWNGPSVFNFQSVPVRLSYQNTTDNLTQRNFSTSYSDFDAYGNAQAISEYGPELRWTNIAYWNNTASEWIIGLKDTETITGIGTIDRDYYSTGRLQRLNRYGVIENYEYYSSGDLYKKKWVRDGIAHEIVYSDYYRGTARAESHPESVDIARGVNATGTVQWERDGKSYTTNFLYDNVNRLKQITPPEGAATTIQWLSPTSVLTSRADYRQQKTLDGLGRVILEDTWDSDWGAGEHVYRRKTYDAEGRLEFESVASHSSTETAGVSYTRDALDRVLATLNTSDGTSRTYCYGGACAFQSDYGSPIQHGYIEKDERGYETVFEFDSFGNPDERYVQRISRQIRKASESGGEKFVDTWISHDADGAIASVTQGGYTRQYEYYPTRLLWKLTEPETGTTTFTYDEVGNLKTRQVGTSGTTTFSYDGRNRRVGIDYPDTTPDVSIEFDENDNLDLVTAGSSSWDYSYDGLDRLKTETLTVGGQTFGFTYNYSATGALESAVYPSGATVSFSPDGLGRPTRVGSYVTLADYHPNGTPELIRLGNGQQATLSLTPRRWPDQYTTTDGFRNVLSLNYDYDVTGNVAAITDWLDSSKTRSMGYDGASRLTSASGQWGTGSMSYDDIGNLKTMDLGSSSLDYFYDSQNRLDYTTGSVAYDFSYDVYGNVTSNGLDTYQFNAASQMTAVPSIPGTSYSYDGNGMRTVAVTPSGTTYYAYGLNGQLLATKELPADVNTEYYYLGSHLVAKRAFGAGVDDDLDNDGIVDDVELLLGLSPANAGDAGGDLDGDGATNLAEYQAGALLDDGDTDDDGIYDGYELRHGLNVKADDASYDPDGDSLTNLQESQLNTDPYDNDTDNDGVPDNVDTAPTFNPALIAIINLILEN